MAELYSFFDPVEIAPGVFDREYSAPEFTDFFKGIISTGIMKGQFKELKVVANDSNMVTEIDIGVAYIEGKRYANTTKLAMTHDTETIGNSRIDRIVVRMDESIEARYVKAFIKKGVPSTNPIPPTLTQTANLYEISLAQVKVVGGQTFIGANAVTDERGKDVICPWAASNILPSFDDNALGDHINNDILHVKYGVDTAGASNMKTVSIPEITEYVDGLAVSFKVQTHHNVSTNAQLKINDLPNALIRKANGTIVPSSALRANGIYTVRYNASTLAFILQGEGGSGNASAPHVLSGLTFTNDEGEFTGTMPDKRSMTSTGTRINSGSQFVEFTIPEGYYNNVSATRVRITDSFFLPQNIKKGIPMLGLVGTLGEKYAYGQAYSTTGGAEYVNIMNLGFRPRVVICKVANLAANNAYAAVYLSSPYVFGDLNFRMTDSGTIYGNGTTSSYIGPNHFRMQVDSINSRLYNWIAFGEESLAN